MDGLQRPSHNFVAPTAVFPGLSVSRAAQDLRLRQRGKDRAKTNQPSIDSQAPDEVEHEINAVVEGVRRAGVTIYADQVTTYADRVSNLDFEGQFGLIRQMAPEAVSDYRADAAQGRDELTALRRQVVETEADRTRFRQKNRIERTAQSKGPGAQVLKAGVLLTLFVGEIVLNGGFLSQGNEQGLLGGAVQAVSFALLNVGVSFLLGLTLLRYTIHRSWALKLVGLASCLAYLAFAVGLNLALAHYREVSVLLVADSGFEVIRRMGTAPFGLTDLNSWVLFGIGLLFSVVAMADGVLWRDPYPGYAYVDRACAAAHAKYTDRKAALIADLKDIREDASNAMNDASRSLSVGLSEYDSAIAGRRRLDDEFVKFQNDLERAARELHEIYREANRSFRSILQPKRWEMPIALERESLAPGIASAEAREELRSAIHKSQALLNEQTQLMQTEFDSAVASYRQLDDLIVDPMYGPAS